MEINIDIDTNIDILRRLWQI